MRDEQKQLLAEKIASVLQNDAEGNEQIWKAIDDLGKRLESLEGPASSSPSSSSPADHSSSRVIQNHPSFEKYAVLEAAEPNGAEEKLCTFEPHGRTCDHCSMCSSRGF